MKSIKKFSLALTALLLVFAAGATAQNFPGASGNPSPYTRAAGQFYAPAFFWNGRLISGNTSTGSQSVIIVGTTGGSGGLQMADGTTVPLQTIFSVLTPVVFDLGQGAQETVTPTAVSVGTCPAGNLGVGGSVQCVTFTGSFNNTHGQSAVVADGTFGLQTAVNYANSIGGGIVTVDSAWKQMGGTNTLINAAIPFANVGIQDWSQSSVQYWNVTPATTTVLTTPTALTAAAACTATVQFCSDPNVAGSASWGGTAFIAISCVDVMGNESISSTTASFTSVASKAIDIGNPAAETGCVGWKPYLSLSGGTYALAYSVPLLTQPTVLQALPVSSGVCVLTTIETITPACAIANATYNQSASNTGAGTGAGGTFKGGAVFTGYPVVTSMLAPNLDSASAQSLNPSNGGLQTYKYVPSNRAGLPGITSAYMSFPITTAAQSTVGQVAGSVHLPPGFLNYAGRTIEICGMLSKTSTTADTITNIQLWWDAEGSNVTAGTAVELSNIQITQTLTAAASLPFCQDITTTVASATATGGTIQPGMGWLTEGQVAAGTIHDGATNILFAAVGSLNLALNANIEVVYNHTTGTDGAGVVLLNPTVKILN